MLGAIGVGRQGSGDMRGFLNEPDVHVAAICDVNQATRERIAATVNMRYGDTACAQYNDYRELIARSDIDCVLIATGERWHPLIACAAARSGKHMYCEKPLALSVANAKAVREAVNENSVSFPVRHAAAVELLLPPRGRAGAQWQNRRVEDHHGRLGARAPTTRSMGRPKSRLRASITTCGWGRRPGRRTPICGFRLPPGCSSATTAWAAWTERGASTTSTSRSGWPTPITRARRSGGHRHVLHRYPRRAARIHRGAQIRERRPPDSHGYGDGAQAGAASSTRCLPPARP